MINTRNLAAVVLGLVLALTMGCGDTPAVKKQKAVARAEQYLKDGKANEAIIELRKALQVDPDFVPALEALGRAYAAKSWYADALRELNRAQRLSPDSTPLMLTMGRTLLEAGAFTDAEAQADKILSRESGNAEAIAIKAAALLGLGKPNEALALVERAPVGAVPDADLVRAGVLLQQGKIDEAERSYRAVVEKRPADFKAIIRLAGILLAKKNYDEALRLYERAHGLRPLSPQPRVGIAAVKARKGQVAEAISELEGVEPQARSGALVVALATFYLQAERPADAERILAPIVERYPAFSSARYLLGATYMTRGRFDLAAAQFEALVKQVPDEPEPHFRLAGAYARMGRGKEALAELDRVAKAMDKTAQFHLERARTLLMLGRTDDALQAARAAERIQPGQPQTSLLLGQIAAQRGDAKTAREMFSKAAEGGGESAAHLALGRLAAQEKNQDAALKEFDAAVSADPSSIRAARAKVGALIQQKRVKEAVDFAEGAARREAKRPEFAMLLGGAYASAGQWDKASAAYRRALDLDPAAVVPRLGLARVALAQRKDEEAIAQLQAALQHDPGNPAAALLITASYESLARYDQAILVMEAAQKAAPTRVDFGLRLAELYFRKGRYDDAVAKARDLLAASPDLTPARLTRGQALLAKGDPAALKDFADVAKEYPKSAAAQYFLARAYLRFGQMAEAQAAFREAIRLDPQFTQAKTELALLSGGKVDKAELQKQVERFHAEVKANPRNLTARESLARHLLALGQNQEAKDQLKAILEAAPGHPAANYLMARVAIQDGKWEEAANYLRAALRTNPSNVEVNLLMAAYLLQANRPEEAVQYLQTVLKVNPNLSTVKVQLGAVYLRLRRYPDALRLAREVQKAEPRSPAGPLLVGSVLIAQQKSQDAIEAFNQALKLNANLDGAYAGLGQAYQQLNQNDKAVEAYQRAVAINAKDVVSLNNLAWILLEVRKKPDEALPLATKAQQLAPESAEVLDTLGWVHFRRGAFADAEKALAKAAERAPNIAAIQFHLGMTYGRLGKRNDAVSALRRAAQLDPKLAESERINSLVREFGG
ncbi:MAG TPA: tetratricopeptide repeat protein [Methylomirabilota bacterium]|nr:tetratricopeptide repeat protein [Methylomirabilota bacterium]